MSIRFQADADLNQLILLAVVRREPTVDFRTAHAASFIGLEDPGVLAFSARDDRLLVTHDHRTMPKHFADFIQRESSPGVLVVPQYLPVSLVADELILLWSVTEPEEWVNRICYLPL